MQYFFFHQAMSKILPESYVISFQFLQVKATLIIVIFAGILSNIHSQDWHS